MPIGRAPAAALVLWALAASGCLVPQLPLAEQSPDLSYSPGAPLLVSVVDTRDWLAKGKRNTFIGRAHTAYGIPVDIYVYPWLSADKKHKKQPLAEALEERIVLGLADEGWTVDAAATPERMTREQISETLRAKGAQRLLVLAVRKWFVSLNLNVVSAFNFDWAIDAEVFDASAGELAKLSAGGRDVVVVDPDQSYPNIIGIAYRERLIKILEEPILRAALAPEAPAPAAVPAGG
jgi:hypothetical protein